MPSRHFSGFLDNGKGGSLHYWLVESERDPESDPVRLWLNGGPGASSLMGFLTEIGPYVIAADGGINYNPYNWAKHANMIYLEAPAGVGFSYCDGNVTAVCTADDDSTSAGNLQALRNFFDRYPKFQQKPFMIWGESYAGIYIPTLSKRVAEAEPPLPVNFLGFSVGNPGTSDKYQQKDPLGNFMWILPDYALNNGLIDDKLHTTLTQECKEQHDGQPPTCRAAWRQYDLLVSGLRGPATEMPGLGGGKGFLDNYDIGSYVGSMQPYWDATTTYLNREDVRRALHVEALPPWGLFATRLVYHKQFQAVRGDGPDDHVAPQHHTDMLPIYKSLVESGHSIMMFSGDADPSVQWRGSELAMQAVGLPEGEGQSWRPWFFREEAAPLDLLRVKAPEWGPTLSASPRRGDRAVLGGYIENWVAGEGTLTFATVRGVGHMVPQFRPQAALHLFARTMKAAAARKGRPPHLAPLLPRHLLQDTSHTDFYGTEASPGLLGQWLRDAAELAHGEVEPSPRGPFTASLGAAPALPWTLAGSAQLLLPLEVAVLLAAACYARGLPWCLRRDRAARLDERLLGQ